MNFSIITPVWNNLSMLKGAIESVANQKNVNVEHVIVDGASVDGTLNFLAGFSQGNMKYISEPDNGIYDALNKGMLSAKNEIIGILHSDDLFADDHVLSDVRKIFCDGYDVVYCDLKYVSRSNFSKTIRYWRSGDFKKEKLRFGWMPPHPTFFYRRALLGEIGYFDLRYRISADYDHMLRFLLSPGLKFGYLSRVVTHMRTGGESNKSLKNLIRKSREDYQIAQHYFENPIWTIFFKNLRKLDQFL